MDTSTLHSILHAQIDLLLGEQRDAVNNHEYFGSSIMLVTYFVNFR